MRPIALLLLLACGACADQAPTTIVGRYVRQQVTARDDPSWRGVVGEWSQEYRSDGRLIVHGAGGMDVESQYRLDGDVLTLNDIGGSGACRTQGIDAGSARYRVHFSGDIVRFDALQDACIGRRSVMTTHALHRVR